MLDPIADKIFLVSSFFSLSFISTPSFQVPSWFVYLLLFREFVLLLGCIFLLALKINFEIQADNVGQADNVVSNYFYWMDFFLLLFPLDSTKTYNVSLILLAGYSIFSLLQYVKVGIGYFKK